MASEPQGGAEPQPPQQKRTLGNLLGKLAVDRRIEKLILHSRITDDADLARIIAKTSTTVLYGMLAVTALGTAGVDTKPFLAGIGVTGFAAGFALKEVATNLISGVLLVFSKPFTKGEYLKVLTGSGLEGEVESIDVRYVILRSQDKDKGQLGRIMIPSAVVYSNSLLVMPMPKDKNKDGSSAPPTATAKISTNAGP